jgi:hypothetical protein
MLVSLRKAQFATKRSALPGVVLALAGHRWDTLSDPMQYLTSGIDGSNSSAS